MNYSAPGIYIKYVTEGPISIRANSTSTAVFVGPTKIGGSVNATNDGIEPSVVRTVADYADEFTTKGASLGTVSMPTASSAGVDHLGMALSGFLINGGSKAYVVSTKLATGSVAATGILALTNGAETETVSVTARSHGLWGEDLVVTAATSNSGAGFADITVTLALASDGGTNTPQTERFLGVAIADVTGLASSLVTFATSTGTAGITVDTTNLTATADLNLAGGADTSASTISYGEIFNLLRDIDDISLIVLPDKDWSGTDRQDLSQAIAHAQFMKDRMVLVQAADDETDFGSVAAETEFVSVYHPKAQITHKNAAGDLVTTTTGLTGHVAGVIARTDQTKGAWTAAAGTHADVRGIASLTRAISQSVQGDINDACVNVVRYINGIPTVWGARTRDKNGIYQYQPVMRTAFLIADSLRTSLEPAVFSKNTEVLWANLKASVTGFMTTLYAQGAFQGATASQAFEVACGLGENMTQVDIDGGLLRVTVRFRAAKPAEFIEVTVEQLFADSL